MGRKRKAEPIKTVTDRHAIRDRLLAAAQSLFARNGVHRTQVAQLATEAGVSVGAFYRYFRDKDELYHDLLQDRFAAYLTEMRSLLAGVEELSMVERVELIAQIFRRSFQMHLEDPHTFFLWYRHGYGVSPEISEVVHGFSADVEALLVQILDRTATVGGQLDTAQRSALATAILGVANSMAHRMIETQTPELEVAVELCTQLTVGGLLAFAPAERREAIIASYFADLAETNP